MKTVTLLVLVYTLGIYVGTLIYEFNLIRNCKDDLQFTTYYKAELYYCNIQQEIKMADHEKPPVKRKPKTKGTKK